jgi:hypothetical protein
MDLQKLKDKAGPWIYYLTSIWACVFFYWFASVWR